MKLPSQQEANPRHLHCMSSSDFSVVDIEEFDDLIASPPSSPRTGTTIDLSNNHPVDMASVSTPPLSKLSIISSDERAREQYVRSTASERNSLASSPDFSSTYKKHERFYFDDGNIAFVMEDVLYKVHRYFFCRDSAFFVNLISNRCGDPSISFSQPFVLKDVKMEEFDAILCILYPLDFYECEINTVKDWTSILRLATQWSFASIRKLAISRLGLIATPIDKIVLGRTYSVDAWLVPGFVAICQRSQPLTRDEGHRLGVDDAVLVACLRESVHTCPTTPTADDITTMVEACLKSPDIADKGPIPILISETLSTEDIRTAGPSDSEPSDPSHRKSVRASPNDTSLSKQPSSISTASKTESKMGANATSRRGAPAEVPERVSTGSSATKATMGGSSKVPAGPFGWGAQVGTRSVELKDTDSYNRLNAKQMSAHTKPACSWSAAERASPVLKGEENDTYYDSDGY